jgi:hypothetical protein
VKQILESKLVRNFTPVKHLFLTFFLLVPTIVFRFQNHHDGYVLQTSRLFKLALEGSFDYPFSQYGPLWSLILGLSNYLFPDNFLLLGIRTLSVLSCALAMYLSARIYLLILEQSLPLTLNLFFVATWYFFGPYYGWPSIFALPVVLAISLLITKELIFDKPPKLTYFWVGFLVGLIQNLRAQVGILLIFSLVFLQILFSTKQKIPQLIFGYTSSVATVFLFLYTKGMLSEALYDQYYFAFKFHISQDRGATRIPYWTLAVAILFLISTYLFIHKYFSKIQIRNRIQILISCSTLLILVFELFISNYILSFFHWRLLQRAYVGVILGIALFIFIRVILLMREKVSVSNDLFSSKQSRNAIISISAISLCVFSQVYPLFSSHHTWYSSLPILLVFSILTNNETHQKLSKFDGMAIPITVLILFIYFFSWHLSNYQSSTRSITGQHVLVDKYERKETLEIKNYLDATVPRNSVVHNLCPDPTIFIVRKDLIPASRLSIWWLNFDKFDEYLKLTRNTSDFIVVCNEFDSRFSRENPVEPEFETSNDVDFLVYPGDRFKG